MQKLGKKMLFSITILGMLLMLTISSGMIQSSTTKTQQSQDASPIIFYTTAANSTWRWNTTWGGTGSEEGNGVAIDTSGDLYCIGTTSSFGEGGSDFALVKFAPTGAKRWNITWGGSSNDIGSGVAVDASGAVYCVGSTNSFGKGNSDFALVKVASNGTRLWNITWGGTAGDTGRSVAVDASGAVYCFGETYSYGAGNADFALVKVAPNGTRLWNSTWGNTGSDYGYGVAVDANGSIYCTGWFGWTTSLGLVKFAPNGTQLWNTTKKVSFWDWGYGVAVDASGAIYCTGTTRDEEMAPTDFVLMKFAPNGTLLWSLRWGGTGIDIGYGVVVDASGAAYCGGVTDSFGTTGNDKFALLKVAPNGTQLWYTTWGGTYSHYCKGLAMDTSGALYCIGYTDCSGISYDFELVKFGYPSGEPGGIPGFELVYLLIGLLALIPLVLRRRFYRTLF